MVGARAMIGQDLANFDEVWLSGMCAASPSHQLPGFKEKVKRAKKVHRINHCPGYNFMIHYWQDPAVKDEVPNRWLTSGWQTWLRSGLCLT